MTELDNFDYGAIATSLGVLILYHIHLFYSVFLMNAQSPQLAINVKNATKWVLKHREKNDAASVTAAIQTIRNSILVSTFIGGGVFSNGIDIANEYPSNVANERMKARSIILSSCLITSFLCWINVIRFSSHLGYLLGTLSYHPRQLPKGVKESDIHLALDASNSTQPTDKHTAIPQTEADIKQQDEEEEEHQVRQCIRAVKNLLINFR